MSTEIEASHVEIERLQARITALETELIKVQARANQVVAEAQDKTYWLDRWHLDLNALMRRRSAERARAVARALRSVVRSLRRAKRRCLP